MGNALFDCTGKVTMVTGGNGGIGLGFAMGCAKMGGDIAIWARNAEKNAASCVSLPMFPELTAQEVDYVIEKVKAWDAANA